MRSANRQESTLKKSRIPRRAGEIDSNTLKSMKSKRVTPAHNQTLRSSSHGNLAEEPHMDFMYRNGDHHPNGKIIKRTKSFWKFGKSDDEILEGMALWQHRDLVQTDTERTLDRKREATLKRFRKRSIENNTISSTNSSETLVNGQNDMHNDLRDMDDVITMNNAHNYPLTKSDIDHRISMQHDDIYGQTEYPKVRAAPINVVSRSKLVRQSYIEMDMENQEQQHRSKREHQMHQEQQQQHRPAVVEQHRSSAEYRPTIEQQQQHQPQQQPQQQREPQPRTRTTIRNKSSVGNSTGKAVSQPHKVIEYYDTSGADNTLKKQRKHIYSNQSQSVDFDDDSVNDHIIMKTVKRQEILKQYYSSGTDTERNSASSSDPYDCIVVDDHLVRRENEKNKNKNGNPKMEFKTFRGSEMEKPVTATLDTLPRAGTLLPRTKLTKSSNTTQSIHQHSNGCVSDGGIATVKRPMEKLRDRRNGRPSNTTDMSSTPKPAHRSSGNDYSDRTVERRYNATNDQRQSANDNSNGNSSNRHSANSDSTNKSYGPWYDLWGEDAPVRMNMT